MNNSDPKEEDYRIEISSEIVLHRPPEVYHVSRDHRNHCRSILFMDEPANLLIAGFQNGDLLFYDSNTYKMIKDVNISSKGNQNIVYLQKWNETEFIVSKSKGPVKIYSAAYPFKELKKFEVTPENIGRESGQPAIETPYKAIRLNEDWLLVQYSTDIFVIFSYSTSSFVKILNMGKICYSDTGCLLLSKKYSNGLYVNTRENMYSIILVDFKNDKVMKEFDGKKEEEIWRMQIYERQGEEFLCTFHDSKGENGIIHVFLTSDQKYERNILLSQFVVSNLEYSFMWGACDFKSRIYSSCVIKNQYFVCGNWAGNLEVYEILEDNSIQKKAMANDIHQGNVYSVVTLGNSSRIMSCTSPGMLVVSKIKGLRIKEDIVDLDEEERIQFLVHEVESYVFSGSKRREIFVKFNAGVFSIENFCRVFLLL